MREMLPQGVVEQPIWVTCVSRSLAERRTTLLRESLLRQAIRSGSPPHHADSLRLPPLNGHTSPIHGLRGGVTDDIGSGAVFGKDELARCANHILGGARFGTDRTDSVLDPDCRAWGFDNLYVTDGCCMPSSGGANPTLTIQANSFRVADILAARL